MGLTIAEIELLINIGALLLRRQTRKLLVDPVPGRYSVVVPDEWLDQMDSDCLFVVIFSSVAITGAHPIRPPSTCLDLATVKTILDWRSGLHSLDQFRIRRSYPLGTSCESRIACRAVRLDVR